MKIPGMQLVKKAERKGNEVEVPVAKNLGLVDFFKLTYKEMNEDHVMAFAGNLTYKGLFAIFPILLALWGISGAFRSVMEAMNVMYEVEEDRPFWKVYGLSIFMSLAVIVLLVGALVLVIFGESIGVRVADLVGLGSLFATLWSIVQWPVVALVVLFAFALIYYFAPAVEQRFRWISPGSILAFVFWLIFSLLFSLYTSIAGSYNETYGSLAGDP